MKLNELLRTTKTPDKTRLQRPKAPDFAGRLLERALRGCKPSRGEASPSAVLLLGSRDGVVVAPKPYPKPSWELKSRLSMRIQKGLPANPEKKIAVTWRQIIDQSDPKRFKALGSIVDDASQLGIRPDSNPELAPSPDKRNRHRELAGKAFLRSLTPEEALELGAIEAELDREDDEFYAPIVAHLEAVIKKARETEE